MNHLSPRNVLPVIVICLSFISMIPAASEIILEPYREAPNDPVLLQKIATRLTNQGLSPGHIDVYAAQIAADKLTFYFHLVDHVYARDSVTLPNQFPTDRYRSLSAFRGPNGLALWVKLFMAISEVSSIPLTSIEGRTGTDPACTIVVQMHDGVFEQTGRECFPKMVSVPTHVDVVQGTADVASAANVHLPEALSIDRVSDVTKQFFSNYGVTPKVGERGSRYVNIKAYGLRNAVVVGEKLWEEVNFCIANTSASTENLELLVVSDGFFTTGLGGPPPETSYTHPFEPQYFKQLDEFSKGFGDYLRNELSGKK